MSATPVVIVHRDAEVLAQAVGLRDPPPVHGGTHVEVPVGHSPAPR